MRFIRVLSLLCGLSCMGVGLANEQQCLAMHTFQTTYNDIRNKADEMAALVQKLKAQLDTTIEQNCGDVGLNGERSNFSLK